jgi:hypothetical protein
MTFHEVLMGLAFVLIITFGVIVYRHRKTRG